MNTSPASATPSSAATLKQWRAIGHRLKPVVMVASKGLSDAVLHEIDRALNDHELIKVKIAVGNRDARKHLINLLCEASGAELVQSIGNIALICRRNPKANPRLSNLAQR